MGADPRDPETRSQASGPGGVALRLGYQGGAAAPHFSGVFSPPCFFGVSSPCPLALGKMKGQDMSRGFQKRKTELKAGLEASNSWG